VSNALRQPGAAVLFVAGAVVGLIGVGLIISQQWVLGLLAAVLGLTLEVSGAALHDRRHRRRGERPHAMWGLDDRNRPSWRPRKR